MRDVPAQAAVVSAPGAGSGSWCWTGVALLVATGRMRLDLEPVVHGPDEASVKGRVTVSPALLGMMGGVDSLEEGFKEDLDPSVEAEIESVSDSDGWQGIAYKMRGPHDVVMGGDLEDAKIEGSSEMSGHWVRDRGVGGLQNRG